jgi:hypothetical protein
VDQVAEPVGQLVVGAGDQPLDGEVGVADPWTSRSSHQRTASIPYSAASAAGSAPDPDDRNCLAQAPPFRAG